MGNPYLGARHLANATVGELQRVNNFLVQISGLPKEVSFLVKGIPLPNSESEVIEVRYGNSRIKLPGPISYDAGDMTIYDSVDLDTEKVLEDWRATVHNPKTDAINRAINFKKDGTITEYTPDGTVGRTWKLEGVWPSAFKPGEMASDGSEVKTISITIQWDRGYRL